MVLQMNENYICLSFFYSVRIGVLVGATNTSIILTGGSAIDVVGAVDEATAIGSATSVVWQASNVTLLECANSTRCDDCVFGNAYRNTVPCRWCFDAETIEGRCIAADNNCLLGTQRATVIAGG